MFSFPICSKPKVPNLYKTTRQHVAEKAVDEIHRGNRHRFLLIAVGGIAPSECHLAILKTEQPAVGNRNSMSVVGQILNHMLRPCKGLLGINDPIFCFEHPCESIKSLSIQKGCTLPSQPQFLTPKGPSQQGEKEAAKLRCQNFYRQKKL